MATDPGGFSVDPGVLTTRLKTSFGEFFDKLGHAGKVIDDSFTRVGATLSNLQKISDDWEEMKANIAQEIDDLKNFEFDAHWKTRVINVPVAIDQIRDLIDEIFVQVKDKLQDIWNPLASVVDNVKEFSHEAEQEGHSDALATATNAEILVTTAIEDMRSAFDAAKDVTELFIDITKRIESASDLFLQQGNPRHRSKEPSTQRVGKLHP